MPIGVVLTQPGGPAMLQVRQIATPAPSFGEVRIRQTIIGVNFVDIYFRSGLYPSPTHPVMLGVEGAGVVDEVGPGVAELRQGDRVAYAGFPLGAYAEVRVLPASRLIRLPDAVSDRAAGSNMLRGLTAHMLLHAVRAVGPGDWVLVHSAAGGLGQTVTRWARRLGANVIGTVGSAAKAEQAEAAGVQVVLQHSNSNWVEQAKHASDGGVHLAVDGIGGAMLAQTLRAIRAFGVVASVGQAAGPIPPIDPEELGPRRSIGIFRPSVLAYANDRGLYQSAGRDLLAAFQEGLLTPIGAEYPLGAAAIAHADLEAGRTTGSVVLTV